MNIFEELYRKESRLSFKRAGITGQITAALFYVDAILTPEQKKHYSYKSLVDSIKELEDSYYVKEEETHSADSNPALTTPNIN